MRGGGTLAGIQIRWFVNLTFYVFQTAVESELELVRTQMKDKSEQHQTLQTVRGTCGLWEWIKHVGCDWGWKSCTDRDVSFWI